MPATFIIASLRISLPKVTARIDLMQVIAGGSSSVLQIKVR